MSVALPTALFILALGLRLWGIDWQLPFAFHPDEGHYVWKAEEMFREGHLNPKYFRNPSLFTYTILGELRLLEMIGVVQPRAEGGQGLLAPPSIYVILGRWSNAILGALTVLALFRVSLIVAGRSAAVLGALFLAVSFLHVRDSHYATNDVPAVALALVSALFAVQGLRQPRWSSFVLAGLLGGLATSAKYSMGLCGLPLVAALALARPAPAWPQSVGMLGLGGAAAGLGYLIGTPYTLLTWDKFSADFRTQMRLGAEGWEGQSSASVPALYWDTLLTGVGSAMLLLALVGVVVAGRRDWRQTCVLLAFPLAYQLFMLRQQLFFARFALPLVPFLALFAAIGLVAMADQFRRPLARPAVLVALTVLALAPSAANVWTHNSLIGQPDTRVVAFRWLVENVPAGARLAIEDYTIRDRRPRPFLDDGRYFDTDMINVNDASERDPLSIVRAPYEYAVTSSFIADRFFAEPTRFARQVAFYQALDREDRPIATFRPGKGDTDIPFDIEDLYTPFWDLQRYERPGPTIKVYALRN